MITFYSMPGCGFCRKAEQLFAKELASGEMVKRPHTSAPAGVRGFPTFQHGDKMHSGLPSSKTMLYAKLDVKGTVVGVEESYRHPVPSKEHLKLPSQFVGVW